MMVSPSVPKNSPSAPIPRFVQTEIFFLSFKWQSAGKACFLFPLLFAKCRPTKANGRLYSQSSSSHSVPFSTCQAISFIRPALLFAGSKQWFAKAKLSFAGTKLSLAGAKRNESQSTYIQKRDLTGRK